jgi:hypothetical protein
VTRVRAVTFGRGLTLQPEDVGNRCRPTVPTAAAALLGCGLGATLMLATVTAVVAAADQWSAAASMHMPRGNHTATVLLTGQVLVVGGDDTATRFASAELYDAASNTWTLVASMGTVRHLHTATLLKSGKVLVAGGSTGPGGILASAEIYDPAMNRWSAAASMSTPRAYATAVLLANGHVMVSGGIRSGRGDGNATAEVYDPVANRWSPTASNAQIQGGQTLTLLASGKVLLVGTGQPQLYDPDINSWSPAGTMAYPRHTHTATLLNDSRVLIAGGFADTGTGGNPQTDATEIYDPAANGWGRGATMMTSRAFHTATLLPNGRVLVAGGETATGPYLATTELYDPVTNRWGFAGPLSAPRGFHTASLLLDGRVLVAGGWGTGDVTPSAEVYEPLPPGSVGSTPQASVSSQVSSPAGTNPALSATPVAASQGALSRLANLWLFLVSPVLLLLAIVTFRFLRRRRRGI